jgi:hypothetical protein
LFLDFAQVLIGRAVEASSVVVGAIDQFGPALSVAIPGKDQFAAL